MFFFLVVLDVNVKASVLLPAMPCIITRIGVPSQPTMPPPAWILVKSAKWLARAVIATLTLL